MDVILTKKAIYDFNEDKYTKIPNKVFNAMAGITDKTVVNNNINELDEVIVFNTMMAYASSIANYDIDTEKGVFVSEKGNIFVFINKNKNNIENGTTDTNKNEG